MGKETAGKPVVASVLGGITSGGKTMAGRPAIFVFTTAYDPFIGGAEIAVGEITKRLKDEFRFFIFTARFRRNLPLSEERNGVVIRRIGFGTSFDKFLVPFLGFFIAKHYMKRERPVLVWAVMASYASGIPYLINLLRLRKPTPIILTLQEGDSVAHIRNSRMGLVAMAWKSALQRTHYLTAISTFLFTLGRDFGYRGEGSVIPNGVDAATFSRGVPSAELAAVRNRLGIHADERVIITTSRLVKKNAIDIVIRALGILAKNRTKIKFLVIGSGGEESQLRELSKNEGVGERVLFLGDIPHSDIPKYLKLADVFVRPSRSEGMGNSFVEAMAAGIPVIGTRVGGIVDFLEDGTTGVVTKVDDPVDLARNIAALFDNPQLRERVCKGGRAWACSQYDWGMIADKFQAVFGRFGTIRQRLLIATPLFPPALGGPATYAEHLARFFSEKGHEVGAISYGSPTKKEGRVHFVSSRLPFGVKHFVYFLKALWLLRRSDAVVALDPFIVGVPVIVAAIILRKPALIRLEGDFLWESYAERTGRDITLKDFYDRINALPLSVKEKIAYRGMRFVFRRAQRVVFSSEWRRNMVERAFGVRPEKSVIIEPAWGFGVIPLNNNTRRPVLLYAGRFVKVKNLARLLRTFLAISQSEFRLTLIGDGPQKQALQKIIDAHNARHKVTIEPPLSQEKLVEGIASCHAFLLPSLSDVSPNVILDCLKTGTPFLLTKESGFYEILKDVGLFVDPHNEADIRQNLRLIMDPRPYQSYQERLENFKRQRSWNEAGNEWEQLLDEATRMT